MPLAALDIRNLSKRFQGNAALSSVTMEVLPGEIRALVGANGSGKSTLIKVLAGYHVPEAGAAIEIAGQPLPCGSPQQSYLLGCRFVHQDLALVDDMSIADNLHLGRFETRFGTIKGRAADAAAAQMLRLVNVEADPSRLVSTLSGSERTGVALARAMRSDTAHPPGVLVLDEPTAALPIDEVDRLLRMIETVAASGVAVLYVTHHLDELYRVADSVTVLRDGVVVAQEELAHLDQPRLIELIAGAQLRAVPSAQPPPSGERQGPPAIAARDLAAGPLAGISLTAHPGEVLGIAGVVGSGREAVLPALFGAIPRSGEVTIDGATVPPDRPDLAISAGCALVPADRKAHGALGALSARENLLVSDLAPAWRRWLLRKRIERTEVSSWFDDLSIRPDGALEQTFEKFSGGNQQKIVLGRCLRLTPKVLLLDEPTQGVDVAAKVAIYARVREAALRETAVLISSTDSEELGLLCSRVLVLKAGRVVRELTGTDVHETEIERHVIAAMPAAPPMREGVRLP